MAEPTHLDSSGRARMVDVAGKPETARRAVAGCRIHLGPEAARTMREGRASKGDVAAAARLAGIQAAKRTAELIPLCHPLRTSAAHIDLEFEEEGVLGVTAEVVGVDRTGFEMEAMVACSIAALTVYDMLKAVEKGIVVSDVRLLEKSGGKSGEWKRGQDS
ncbi:MAG: cyclic pyranopterin monophosphate synthase MoaC [Planctomycetota bacterium]|jgi:cyclic pyranopterin phosphate synthase